MATMTPEQREARNARDRERRAQRAQGQAVTGGRERAPKGPTRRKPTQAALRKNVETFLVMGNLTAAGLLPPSARPDLLTPDEAHILATGIAAELHANPKALAYVQRVVSSSGPHLTMLAACAVVAAPRLARRGVLPIPLAQAVMMAGTAAVEGTVRQEGNDDASGMEAWAAPVRGGGDGLGQVNADGVAGEATEVPPHRPDQA